MTWTLLMPIALRPEFEIAAVRSAAEALATIAPTNTKPAHKIPKFLIEVSS
jgi:hypothetical protein